MLLVRSDDHVAVLVDVEEARAPPFDVVEGACLRDVPVSLGADYLCGLRCHGWKIIRRTVRRSDSFAARCAALRLTVGRSWIQGLHPPALPFPPVEPPLVQPAGHVVPELDPLRDDPEAGPVRRTRHVSA